MKRREFLKNSAGMISLVVPAVLHANQKPCPPSRVGVSGGTAVNVSCVSPADVESDWLARSKGPGVVWAHDFRYQEELSNFLKLGGDLTPEYPAGLMPQRVAAGIGGGHCLKFTNFGTTLAKDIRPTDTQIELVDATDFPDPQNGRFPYRVVLQVEKVVDKQSNRRENLQVTAKNGRVLTVQRATRKSSEAMAWTAGTAIGWDCEGQWARPMSAFRSGSNGLPYNDPAAGGGTPHRTYAVKAGSDATSALWNFREGYWGHRDYHTKYPTWLGNSKPWNGDDFYIQFRVKIDRQRFTPDNDAGGKLFFLHATGGGPTQLVGKMFPKRDANKSASEFGMFTNYGNGLVGQSILTDPQGGGKGANLQPGSSFDGCLAGANQLDCWEWPVDEWVTVLLRVKPGHHNDSRYGLANAGPAPKGSIAVNTTAFKPVNDGTAIEFETNAVPKPDEFDFAGRLDNAASGYFHGWAGVFNDGSLAGLRYKVISYSVLNGRARWRIVPFRERDALPTGVPSTGDAFGVEWGSLAESAKYKDTLIETWVAREGERDYTRVFSKRDIVYLFGDDSVSSFGRHPPAFNLFQLTSYQNVQDGNRPPRKTYSYWFDQVILSTQFVPCPQA
jgi:hypothetical protein